MFSIRLTLKSFNLTGIEALDTRRRLRLPDGVRISHSETIRDVPVSESVARQHFGKRDIIKEVFVLVDWLKPGDVELIKAGSDAVRPTKQFCDSAIDFLKLQNELS